MKKPKKQSRGTLVVVVIIAIAGIAAWQGLFGMNFTMHNSRLPKIFQNNGERIYFTATTASGLAISSRGGRMGMMAGMGGCVNCHGAKRQGSRLTPRFWIKAPALTPQALFQEHDDDGHGDHEGYSEESLRRAITQGIDAGGKPLDPIMPRWSMSEKDLDDLVIFLKSPVKGQ
jgi:mono/diheme cytochrome c family protein